MYGVVYENNVYENNERVVQIKIVQVCQITFKM